MNWALLGGSLAGVLGLALIAKLLGLGDAALTDSAMRGHDMDASLVGVPIKSPHIVSTLCLVQSAKKKATPLIRRTAELLRRLSLQVCAVESGTN